MTKTTLYITEHNPKGRDSEYINVLDLPGA